MRMKAIEFQSSIHLTIVVVVVLIALMALPAFGSHTCVEGSDDYDQCMAQQPPSEQPTDTGAAPPAEAPAWIPEGLGGVECDDDDDTPAPPCE